MAVTAAMYSTLRTSAWPPAMARCPRMTPESRLIGATPTKAARLRRSVRPSSGRSAIRVRAVIGPTPGTEVSKSSAARQAGEPALLVVDLAVGGGERSFERFQRAAMPLSTFAPSLDKVDVCAYVR